MKNSIRVVNQHLDALDVNEATRAVFTEELIASVIVCSLAAALITSLIAVICLGSWGPLSMVLPIVLSFLITPFIICKLYIPILDRAEADFKNYVSQIHQKDEALNALYEKMDPSTAAAVKVIITSLR